MTHCHHGLTIETVESILQDENYRVRPKNEQVPKLLQGLLMGDVFAKLMRMNDGDFHHPLKSAMTNALMSFDDDAIRRWVKDVINDTQLTIDSAEALNKAVGIFPILVVASSIGIQAEQQLLATHIRAFVTAMVSPDSAEVVKAGNESAQWLYGHVEGANGALKLKFIEACDAEGIDDTQVIHSNLLGLFFQTMDGTSGLIGQMLIQSTLSPQASIDQWQSVVLEQSPPICNTRRFKNNRMILLPLRDDHHALAFGTGRHGCPGSRWATIIADEVVRYLYGVPIKTEWLMNYRWKASPNARVPEFLTKHEGE